MAGGGEDDQGGVSEAKEAKPGARPTLSLPDVLRMQRELYAAFSEKPFQEKLEDLNALEGKAYEKYTEDHRRLFATVQDKILPKYGFPTGQRGVLLMLQAAARYNDNPEVTRNRTLLNQLLGLEKPPERPASDGPLDERQAAAFAAGAASAAGLTSAPSVTERLQWTGGLPKPKPAEPEPEETPAEGGRAGSSSTSGFSGGAAPVVTGGELVEGADALISGMTRAEELNGRKAKLVAFEKGSGRWKCEVEGVNSAMRIKSENLAAIAVPKAKAPSSGAGGYPAGGGSRVPAVRLEDIGVWLLTVQGGVLTAYERQLKNRFDSVSEIRSRYAKRPEDLFADVSVQDPKHREAFLAALRSL